LGGREKSILQGVERHLSLVKECVITYQKLIPACAVQDPAAHDLLGAVFRLETEADELQRELSRNIAEGAFFGGVREDILTLIGSDDSIADATKDAARLLMMGADGDPAFLGLLQSPHMASFQKNLLGAVTSLEALIQALQLDKKSVLSRVRAVEDLEEAADTDKDGLLRQLFSRPATMNPVSIIQLRDFIFASDDIADNAERASDVVLVLVAKGYG
jgi:predicted phosphate transport protein (TIGR00153 family)